jgi:hypothetical protein
VTNAPAAVEMRWLPGLGPSCPGAVDLTTIGPLGRIERAVALPEALTLGAVIDLFCPASNWFAAIHALAPAPPDRSEPEQ